MAVVADGPTCTGVWACVPTYGVTVCPVIALSPSLSDADQLTRAEFDAGSRPDGRSGPTARPRSAA